MTTPASGAISILNIRNEFDDQYGAYNDMNSWSVYVLGRTSGSAVALSEFYNRTNEWRYSQILAYPNYSGEYVLSTPWGAFNVSHANDPTYHQFVYYDLMNPTATAHFYGVYVPSGLYHVSVFTNHLVGGDGRSLRYYENFSGPTTPGTMYWAFR